MRLAAGSFQGPGAGRWGGTVVLALRQFLIVPKEKEKLDCRLHEDLAAGEGVLFQHAV